MFLARSFIRRECRPALARFMSKERAGKSVKPGAAIVLDGVPFRVVKIIQGKRGKGGGFVRATVKSLVNSAQFEKTFTSDEMVEHADLEKDVVTYSWADEGSFVFMHTQTFEEIRLPKEDVDTPQFMYDGLQVKLLKFNEKYIGVELPIVVEIEVVKVDDSKLSNDMIPAKLSTGGTLMVPKFIKDGTMIRVNTVEGHYVERVV